MQNNNSNNYLQEDEIDLKEIFKLLINSKKLIIAITLVITTLGAIYSFQKAPKYESSALIEIGQYDTLEEENILLESASESIQNLNIVFIHKSIDNESLSIKTIEDKLIKIKIDKPSIELGKKTLDEIARYIENRHSLLLSNLTQKAENQLAYEIESLNDQIEFTNSTLLTQNEDEKIRIANEIESLNNQIKYSKSALLTQNEVEKIRITNEIFILNNKLPIIDLKINALNKVILEDQNNLELLESDPDLYIQRAAQSPTLNQVIHAYKYELFDFEAKKINLSQDKDNLESQLKRLESNYLESDEIFKLSQDKDRLELELELLMKRNSTSTQLIGKIVTNEISLRKELTILLIFIIGLFLSIIMVFINNSLKALKEEQV